ncbi:stalk domain-containing protein [Paenibacillus solani]|uniref:Copper amine oxidase n=1 Tax=Paenibacillus solani TaxID=1705565 RepID=A0A0M1P2B8_9BACL|nr:stalk domain-containing protein [Paenibacillus solani]KOR88621.1 copper amine oxidase [Paenibacillus solani]
MNFKRISMITVLAAAQVSMAFPVAAESPDITAPALSSPSALQSPVEGQSQQRIEQQTDLQQAEETSIDPVETPSKEPATTPSVDKAETPPADSTKISSDVVEGTVTDSQIDSSVSHEEKEELDSVPSGNTAPENETGSQTTDEPKASASNASTNELVLLMNSNVMYHNGKQYKAGQPMAVKQGVSYVAIRAMVERAGLKLSYDNKTKETIIFKDGNELRFTTGSSQYKVNGQVRQMKGPAYQNNNVFMVPLTSITQALDIPYKVNQSEKKVILDLSGMGSGSQQPGGNTGGGSGSGVPNIPNLGPNDLILMMNSNKMYQNGKEYTAGQPMAVKNGVSYVAIRSLVNRVGLKLTYDGKTKETIIIRGNDELRFKTNSSVYTVNGVKKTMKGPAYQSNNTFMVPLTSITQALDINYRVDQPNKRVILSLSSKPVASFTVQPGEILAGQTTVTYKTNAYSPTGLDIVDEYWEGREEIFDEPGIHTVTYSVQDSSGEWSDPYSLSIHVSAPNTPPVAMFDTDKQEYKIGEKITYINQSYDNDPGDTITSKWENNDQAFFTPGPHKVLLIVTDKHGATSSYEKIINVTTEVLYTRDQFNHLFTNIGDKYTFNGTEVPTWNVIPMTRSSEPSLLIRSNSPETVYQEGILYREVGNASTRFMIHHLNATGRNMKMYVVATNINSMTARLTTEYTGVGGPINIPTATGKAAVERYLESMQSADSFKTISLAPGESRIILQDLSSQTLKNQQVLSMFADLYSDSPIRYDVIMIDEVKDPIQKLPYLKLLARDGVHNRGTYPDSTRIIESYDLVGNTPTRLPIGDKTNDPNLEGYDGINGSYQSNAGNFGVLYKIKLHRVAPRTLITLNPRGGKYMGVMMVNGNIIQTPNTSGGAVSAPNEAAVLYRTGDYEQTVEILFTAAPGSSLPINLLLQPLPQVKH